MTIDLWELPVPATSLFKGPTFFVLTKRQCQIQFEIEDNDGKILNKSIIFEGVESFKCTYITSCNAKMINMSYAKLVCLDSSPWLLEILDNYKKNSLSEKQLKHLMICFDDGPCYEFICLSFSIKEDL